MVKIDPDTLYRLEDLEELLRDHVELPTFLDRLGLKKDRVFRDAIWGFEILEAARKAPSYASLTQSEAVARGNAAQTVIRNAPGMSGPKYRLSARDLQD